MSQFPPGLLSIARAVTPDSDPDQLLSDTGRFLCHVMARCDSDEIETAYKHFSKEQFRSAYQNAPPGIFFPPSWQGWGVVLFGSPDHLPPPPGYPEPEYIPEEPGPAKPASAYPPELLFTAQVVNWYTKPEELLRHTGLFLNQVMARGGPEELRIANKYYTREQFQAAYENAPSGEYYRPRWAYWGLKLFGNPEHKPYPIRFPAYDLPDMGFPDR